MRARITPLWLPGVRRDGQRLALVALVELLERGAVVCTTTMIPPVSARDPRVRELVRRHRHEPRKPTDAP